VNHIQLEENIHRGDGRADLGDEHHRVLPHVERIELDKAFFDGRQNNLRVE
jgi:hypothetical protein